MSNKINCFYSNKSWTFRPLKNYFFEKLPKLPLQENPKTLYDLLFDLIYHEYKKNIVIFNMNIMMF